MTKKAEQLDQLAQAEKFRDELAAEVDKKLSAVNLAVGNDALDKALLGALAAHRRFVGFSHELAEITGRKIYEHRRTLSDRVGSEFLQRRIQALKGAASPRVELPGKDILEALRQAWPRREKIFEGAAEWKAHLEAQGLTEADPGELHETSAERRRRQNPYGG